MNVEEKGVLILTEAGENIGFGHYTRCLAIQKYLLEQQISCEMLLNLVGNYELTVKQGNIIDWFKRIDFVKNKTIKYKTVLVDSYLATKGYFAQLKQYFQKVIVLDDYNRITYNVDMIINPNVFAPSMNYDNQIAKIYGGVDFVILRKAFQEQIILPINEQVKQLVITVGGSDYRKILPKLINIVAQFVDVTITVITGNESLQKELKQDFKQVQLLGFLSAEEMLKAFQKADIVIAACGQTLHELASTGKPTIGVCLDIDQVPNQQFYVNAGFLTAKIHYTDLTKVKTQLQALQSLKIRQKVSNVGLKLINQSGVKNISKLLTN